MSLHRRVGSVAARCRCMRNDAGVPPQPAEPWIADLHIHSKYSRACSRDLELENLAWWARRKGITLLGTGDFTHPGWFDHLRDGLRPAEPGLYRLAPEREAAYRPQVAADRARPQCGSCSRSRSPRSTSGTTARAKSTT